LLLPNNKNIQDLS